MVEAGTGNEARLSRSHHQQFDAVLLFYVQRSPHLNGDHASAPSDILAY